tara:strand:- start:54 stop:293 length:240 start_codon:yes stop_codon:yes gene_type:complete
MKKVLLTIVLGLFAVGCETPLGPDYGDYDPWEKEWHVVCYDEYDWSVSFVHPDGYETEEGCEETIHEDVTECLCEYINY